MNPFRIDSEITSYKFPIVKIGVCVAVILVLINRNRIFPIDNTILNDIVGIISGIIAILSVFCIYISVGEFDSIKENRDRAKPLSDSERQNAKRFSLEEIVSMVRDNDILDIQIISKNKRLEIGASADCKPSDSNFFDKRYYIGEDEYESIGDFKLNLSQHLQNGRISVISIDGIKQ